MSESLEKKEYYTNLFDFYESLFTDKQIEYFKEYYFYDLSLSEIAENHSVSRAAVHDVITKMHSLLDDYEEKLGLLNKYNKINSLCEEYEKTSNHDLQEFTKKIKEII